MATKFDNIYSKFLSRITDDMFMEITAQETELILKELLIAALPYFEFPRVDIFDYDADNNTFNIELTNEEQNVISIYMVVVWLGQQLASVEVTRMKYSGSDFKFTSQANHMTKLQTLKSDYERLGFHMQRLYKRRIKNDEGKIVSTFNTIMEPIGD